MAIQFNPSLGKTTKIQVPISNDGVVRLRFVASVDAGEYERLERRGVQVQLWSDIPAIGSGRYTGQWGDITFKREAESTVAQKTNGTADEGVVHLDTRLSDHEASDDQNDVVRLSFETDVQLAGPSTLEVVGKWQFSFTYRLVGASGEITWLGQFGNDGVLVLSSEPPVTPIEKRVADEHGATEWLRLGQTSKYSVAAISKSGSLSYFPHSGDVEDANMLLLVPRIEPQDILLNPALLLSASSPESGLYIRGNDYALSVRAPLGLHTIETSINKPGFQHAVHKILASGFPDALRVANAGSTQDAANDTLVLSSVSNVTPTQVIVVPAPGASQSIVTLDTQQLSSVLPSETEQFVVYSPSTGAAALLLCNREARSLKISTDSTGAVLLFSAAYAVPGSSEKDNTPPVFVSFITEHTFSSYEYAPDVLPTPPPSPKRALEASLSIESASSSSFPPESDALSPSTSKSSDFTELTTSLSNTSDLSSVSASSSQSDNQLHKGLSVQPLTVRHSRGMVVSCMGLFVHMAKVFIKSVFCRVFHLIFGPSRMVSARSVKRVEKEKAKEETKQSLPEVEYEEKQEVYTPSGELPTIEEEVLDTNATSSPAEPAALPPTIRRVTHICFDVQAGKNSFLSTDSSNIFITQNGQPVKVYADGLVASRETAMQKLAFDLDVSGRVKVRLA
ncbi:hypothetical protein ONZ45_g7574 [Pleurotus djamor]|nr:hypothetical protein ONZ45_g7574 [Pleurotus djamor]